MNNEIMRATGIAAEVIHCEHKNGLGKLPDLPEDSIKKSKYTIVYAAHESGKLVGRSISFVVYEENRLRLLLDDNMTLVVFIDNGIIKFQVI